MLDVALGAATSRTIGAAVTADDDTAAGSFVDPDIGAIAPTPLDPTADVVECAARGETATTAAATNNDTTRAGRERIESLGRVGTRVLARWRRRRMTIAATWGFVVAPSKRWPADTGQLLTAR